MAAAAVAGQSSYRFSQAPDDLLVRDLEI